MPETRKEGGKRTRTFYTLPCTFFAFYLSIHCSWRGHLRDESYEISHDRIICFIYRYWSDDWSIITDDCTLSHLTLKKKRNIRELKWQTLVQHEYHSQSDYYNTPVTSQGKISSHCKQRRIWVFLLTTNLTIQMSRAEEYTNCISTEEKESPKECPDMTLNNLMLNSCNTWDLRNAPLLPGPLWPRVLVHMKVSFMGKKEPFKK